MNVLKNLLIKYLEDTVADLENGTCEVSEELIKDALRLIAHRPMSKEQACNYLHMSRSVFDAHIRNFEIPRGLKRSGFKELVWYEDELDDYKLNNNGHINKNSEFID